MTVPAVDPLSLYELKEGSGGSSDEKHDAHHFGFFSDIKDEVALLASDINEWVEENALPVSNKIRTEAEVATEAESFSSEDEEGEEIDLEHSLEILHEMEETESDHGSEIPQLVIFANDEKDTASEEDCCDLADSVTEYNSEDEEGEEIDLDCSLEILREMEEIESGHSNEILHQKDLEEKEEVLASEEDSLVYSVEDEEGEEIDLDHSFEILHQMEAEEMETKCQVEVAETDAKCEMEAAEIETKSDIMEVSKTEMEAQRLRRVSELLDTVYGDNLSEKKKMLRASKVLEWAKGKEDVLVDALEEKAAAVKQEGKQ